MIIPTFFQKTERSNYTFLEILVYLALDQLLYSPSTKKNTLRMVYEVLYTVLTYWEWCTIVLKIFFYSEDCRSLIYLALSYSFFSFLVVTSWNLIEQNKNINFYEDKVKNYFCTFLSYRSTWTALCIQYMCIYNACKYVS